MAKGNMLLGMARGSVGDVTFYRDGGLQRARSRNRQPNNPRSNKQQTQRALFANCVKFYKLTAAKFYKFAFENKKTNESDYNAFMRENLKRGVMISKTAFYVEAYPALGNWLMSRGSLASIVNANDDTTASPVFDLGAAWTGIPDDNVTIGAMSTAMVASGRYEVGDIITMVRFSTKSLGQALPTATPDATKLQSLFEYFQFLVDPNNTQKFLDLFGDTPRFHLVTTATSNTLAIEYGIDNASALEDWQDDYNGITVIHSRNTAQGLRVSTQELVVNPRYQSAIETALTDANYKSAVLTDWQSSGLAILQGEGLELLDPISYLPTTSKYVVSLHQTSDPSSAGDVYNIPFGGVLASNYGYLTAPQIQYDFKSEEMAIRAQTILQSAETPVLRIDGNVVPISNIEVSRIETVVFVEITIAGQQLTGGVSTLQFTCNGVDWATATANIDFNVYGNYTIGNKLDGTTRTVSIGNVTGCSDGDGNSLHVQTANVLTAAQVIALFRQSIVNTEGLDVDYNAARVVSDVAPEGLHGYSCEDLLIIRSLPATLQFKTESGATRSVSYTA